LDKLFSDATLFKLNFIGIQHLEYLDIREIKTLEKPLTLQKGQGFVEGHKILTLTLTLLTPTHDPWRVGKPLHITTFFKINDWINDYICNLKLIFYRSNKYLGCSSFFL